MKKQTGRTGLTRWIGACSTLGAAFGLLSQPAAAQVVQERTPEEVIEKRADTQRDAAGELGVEKPRQVLFGDTHVHTTYSVDAYFWSLPLMQGQGSGAYPPWDACDYARFCSALDFYVLTDHAEAYTKQHWETAKESIRQCNAVAGDPDNPDLVAYMGYEWTQVGATPEDHFGHKNVFFKDDGDDDLPARPIAAPGVATDALRGSAAARIGLLGTFDPDNAEYYRDFLGFSRAMQQTPPCEEGVSSPDLPEDCFESAATPADLFEKLDQWNLDTIVVPHGSTWGFYTPPTTTFDKHLADGNFNPDYQRMIEIYSGHGNSEQYRDWRAIEYDEAGQPYCPEPTDDYLPQCWQAGEIIYKRCIASGEFDEAECERRRVDARQKFVEQPTVAGFLTVPGADVTDWLDSGQARDMFIPAFNYRPAESVQYSIAIGNFDDPENPLRHTWGFIGSSDNHRARAGTGYKETDRHVTTEGSGPESEFFRQVILGEPEYPVARAVPLAEATQGRVGFALVEAERQASFFASGGLAAVHTEGRNRDQIWDAMKRKEVYGTSGDRILLWFDLLNGPDGKAPMGAEVELNETPRFEVRAVGAFKQLPGCPDHTLNAVSPERLNRLCETDCYNPSDERKLITRIEVVRIHPQNSADKDVGQLIEDPWKVLECEPDQAGCRVEFTDEEFTQNGRNALYYVRAIQEPSPAVNGGGLRPQKDRDGNVIAVRPCYGDHRTPEEDDCLEMVEERAWSSPIYVDLHKS